jgi:hypothetical protein
MWRIVFLAGLLYAQPVFGQTMEPAVAQYLSRISQYAGIKLKSKDFVNYGNPIGRQVYEGLYLLREYDGIHEFATGNFRYNEITYVDGGKGKKTIRRERSWNKGLKQEFMDAKSDGLDPNDDVGGGAILEKEFDYSELPSSPGFALGFFITAETGQVLHLKDLILRKPPQKTASGSFLIENIYDWPQSFGWAYDLEFELDSENGFMPSKAVFWDRSLTDTTKNVLFSRTVEKFSTIGNLPVPTDILMVKSKQIRRILIDPKQCVLNPTFTEEDYNLSFPKDQWHADLRTGKKYVNGVESELNPATKSQATRQRLSFVAWSIVVLTLFVVVLLIRRRYSSLVLLIFAGSLGCTGTITSSDVERSSSESRLSILVRGGTQQSFDFRVGLQENNTLTIQLENDGDNPLELDNDIRATCGCLTATLDRTILSPGDVASIIARIQGSPIPGQRVVVLTVPVTSPNQDELQIQLNLNSTVTGTLRPMKLN